MKSVPLSFLPHAFSRSIGSGRMSGQGESGAASVVAIPIDDTVAQPSSPISCGCGAGDMAGIVAGRAASQPSSDFSSSRTAVVSASFGLSILSQVLAFGILPLAAAGMTTGGMPVALPSLALLAGSMLASLFAPAAFSRMGMRAAFALGMLVGVWGGVVLAAAIFERSFAMLLAGAGAVGVAQAVGIFTRHSVLSAGPSRHASQIGIVLAAGAMSGLVGPAIVREAEMFFSPYLYVGSALAIGAVHVLALACIAGLPSRLMPEMTRAPRPRTVLASRPFDMTALTATSIGALAWFSMSATMVATPLAMAACGIAMDGIATTVSWHVVAMYAPALAVVPLSRRFSPHVIAGLGMALIGAGAAGIYLAETRDAFTLAMVLAGSGWAFSTCASGVILHAGNDQAAAPGLHDACLFAAALAGALVSGALLA